MGDAVRRCRRLHHGVTISAVSIFVSSVVADFAPVLVINRLGRCGQLWAGGRQSSSIQKRRARVALDMMLDTPIQVDAAILWIVVEHLLPSSSGDTPLRDYGTAGLSGVHNLLANHD